MGKLLISYALIVITTQALAADFRDEDYSNPDAGYLVMAIGQKPHVDVPDLTIEFRKSDRSDQGFIHYPKLDGMFALGPVKDFDDPDERGMVIVRALPPGDYEIYRLAIKAPLSILFPFVSVPFTVRANETTYLGDFNFQDRQTKSGSYRSTEGLPEYNYFLLSNKSSRDLPIAQKSKKPPHGMVTIETPDVTGLHSPFFLPSLDTKEVQSLPFTTYNDLTTKTPEIRGGHYADVIRPITESLNAKIWPPYLEAVAHGVRGRILLQAHQDDEAIADFNQGLSINAYAFDIYADRGTAYRDKGMFDLALADQTQAIESDREASIFRDARANTYIAMGQYDLALADVSEAIRIAPKDPSLYPDRKVVLLNSAAFFGPAGINNPIPVNNMHVPISDYYADRAYIDQLRGQPLAVLTDSAVAISLLNGKVSPGVYRKLGHANLSIGQYSRAIAYFTKVLEAGFRTAEDYAGRCFAITASRNDDRGMSDCNKAVALDSNSSDARNTRGFAYLKLRQYARAIEDYTEAVRIDSNSATSLYGRGIAKTKSGDAEGGAKDMDDAKQIDADVPAKMAKIGIAP